MKKSIRFVGAAVAALAIAVVPAVSAQAAASYTGYISTDAGQLTYQYDSVKTNDGSIQAVLAGSSDLVTLVYAADDSQVVVTDAGSDISSPYYGAFSPDGSTLYVSNYGSDTIVVIDVATATVVDTLVTTNQENLAIGVSPDGTKLVVTDDYDDITVYDLATGNSLSNGSLQDTYNIKVVFINDSSFYTLGYYGNIEIWDLSDVSTAVDSYTVENGMDAYGQCVTGDLSTLITVDDAVVQFSNLADGSEIGTLDLSGDGATGLAQCDVTPDGKKVVVTDWNMGDGINPPGGYVYVVDVTTMALDELINTTDVSYTDAVSIMSECKVYADGYNENIAIIQLDKVHCELTPNLPDTGASQGLIITLASVGGGLLVLGVIALVLVRRRNAKA